ncbi:Cu(I)-responsive transcriptional regulator [Shewanella sp. NIFS-20-20]|uniref:Cu(I)-responsive transcriptional regulator n=1 Tax=Shewanella sp. NIFS-20-20 TaxID=2853806 RepID=UPI001C446EBF|nr:Cu(I)-responsive transcriptional regulator [Shewanella sp. NIFS-20-20]MBV7316813.1 Cu(I)-responsive transcriptional regulator [Shewanella sp. NIFS-20-20]
MKIGEVANKTGMSIKSIRYYHDIGLITAARGENGYRDYRDREVDALMFVHHCRHLGFSLDECRELLSLKQNQQRTAKEVKRLAREHLAEVNQRISQLTMLANELTQLVAQCRGDDGNDCFIINGLGKNLSDKST